MGSEGWGSQSILFALCRKRHLSSNLSIDRDFKLNPKLGKSWEWVEKDDYKKFIGWTPRKSINELNNPGNPAFFGILHKFLHKK